MKKLISLSILIALFINLSAQIDCSMQTINFSIPDGYEKSDLSKSAVLKSGEVYEFVIPLYRGKEYRLYFMASSVFNNRIDIEIEDMNSEKTVYDVDFEKTYDEYSRETYNQKLLKSEWNDETNKMEYPYITLEPANATRIKIILNVLEAEKDEINIDKIKVLRGCFSVIVLEKGI